MLPLNSWNLNSFLRDVPGKGPESSFLQRFGGVCAGMFLGPIDED
jgi:hypothetical protein